MKLKRTNSKEYNKALKSALIEMINTEYLGDRYDPKKPFTSIVKIAEIEKLYKDNRQNYLKDWLMGNFYNHIQFKIHSYAKKE